MFKSTLSTTFTKMVCEVGKNVWHSVSFSLQTQALHVIYKIGLLSIKSMNKVAG